MRLLDWERHSLPQAITDTGRFSVRMSVASFLLFCVSSLEGQGDVVTLCCSQANGELRSLKCYFCVSVQSLGVRDSA